MVIWSLWIGKFSPSVSMACVPLLARNSGTGTITGLRWVMRLISWISSLMLVTSGPARSTAVSPGCGRSTARASASPRSSTHTG
jgi:hypothetical protein